jgi:predicted porin
VTGLHTFTGLTLGGKYQFCRRLGLYARANKSLTELKELPQVYLGVDYEHCKGFGVKAALDVSSRTLSENVNFTLNKTFSGSFLFDVGCQ